MIARRLDSDAKLRIAELEIDVGQGLLPVTADFHFCVSVCRFILGVQAEMPKSLDLRIIECKADFAGNDLPVSIIKIKAYVLFFRFGSTAPIGNVFIGCGKLPP
jgi:hypothetical protein